MPKAQNPTNETPVGGRKLPGSLRRNLAAITTDTSNPLVKHILRLKALHPDVNLKFRDVKLSEMDDATLRLLIEDLEEQLGVD